MKNPIRNPIQQDVQEWIFGKTGSKAETDAGRERAIQGWLADQKVNFVEATEQYISYLQGMARGEMDRDFAHRKVVAAERKAIKRHPIWVRAKIASTKEVRKTYRHVQSTMDIPEWIDNAIASMAFNDVFSGTRYRKIFIGQNKIEDIGLYTKDNGKYGWDRVVYHYANYTAIGNGRSMIAYRTDHTADFEIFYYTAKTLKARGCIYRKPAEKTKFNSLSPHHMRRFFSLPLKKNSPIKWVWDRKEKAGYYVCGEERYHTWTIIMHASASRECYKEAIKAFQIRKKEKLADKRAAEVFKHLDRIYVDYNASIQAGNCKDHTRTMQTTLADIIAGYYGKDAIGDVDGFAVRADFIWKRRSDNYAKRAILKAAERIGL